MKARFFSVFLLWALLTGSFLLQVPAEETEITDMVLLDTGDAVLVDESEVVVIEEAEVELIDETDLLPAEETDPGLIDDFISETVEEVSDSYLPLYADAPVNCTVTFIAPGGQDYETRESVVRQGQTVSEPPTQKRIFPETDLLYWYRNINGSP